MGYEMNITIDSWEYDRIAWTLKLKRTISHVWCEELKIIIIPVDPVINREAYVSFRIITNKVQSISCWNRALHQADGFGISQVNLAVLESTLVDLVCIHPVSNVELVQIWVTMFVATNIPFVVQFISKPARLKHRMSFSISPPPPACKLQQD
jgi:hypothetical protein